MMRVYAIGAAVAIAALLGGTYLATQSTDADDQFAHCRSSQVGTGAASIGGPFTLIDEDGQEVTEKDVITKPTLVYFGYTFCPDVCPLDSSRNAEALDLLQGNGIDAQAVFISIDPERDGVEQVKEFTSYVHDDMIGLTGSVEQVKAASRAYKTYFRKQEPEEGMEDFYLVDHSTFTYLMLPETGFAEFFKRDDSPETIAEKVSCFSQAAGT